jgi:protein MpaA
MKRARAIGTLGALALLGKPMAQADATFAQQVAIPNLLGAKGAQLGLSGDALPLSVFYPLGASSDSLQQRLITSLCNRVNATYSQLGWKQSPCGDLNWTFDSRSEKGNPLIYWEFKDDSHDRAHQLPLQTTLILGGVHPDEITPVHLAFAFAKHLRDNPRVYRNSRVIIAPLVNPDGFFVNPKTRTNTNGIDLNRNFATADWWQRAGRIWRDLRQKDPRHFPGQAPNTEQGTRFQIALIEKYDPDKILTIHAPLGFIDYDGPGDASTVAKLGPNDLRAIKLARLISKESRNYRLIDYAYFPGSLGNFAGNDRRIPTITVELNTTNPKYADAITARFFPGLTAAVSYEFKRDLILVTQGDLPRSAENSTQSQSQQSRNF